MSDLPELQQTADYLAAALVHNQHLQQPPHPPPPATMDQHWMAGLNSQQAHSQTQQQQHSLHQPYQHPQQHYYQPQNQHEQPMDVGLGTAMGAVTALSQSRLPQPPVSSSSSASSSTASHSTTPSPPRPRSSLGQPQPPLQLGQQPALPLAAHSTVYSSAASHSYHVSPSALPPSIHTGSMLPPYSATYPPPAGVTLATPVMSSSSDAPSPPPSGHWFNPAHLPLPSTASLSRSTSSSLPSSSASFPSSPLLQSTPPPPRLHRRTMGPTMSANVSPATPHSLGAVSLHSSSPVATPDLPPLHPNSVLPLGQQVAAMQQQQQQQSQSSAPSQLPPFHPPSSSHSLHSSPSQMSQPSPSVTFPPLLQVPRSRGQSAASSWSSSSSAPNSPTPLQHHIPSCTLSLDGQFQDANPAFLATFQFFGLPALQQHSIYSIIHPTEHLSFMVMMRRIMTGKVKSLAQEKLCVPVSHGNTASRPIPMWLMMSAVTLDEKLLTLYCCFLPKPRREESEEDEREKAELRLELEGRAQLQHAQLELQDEMLRIERMYQQQFAALNQQQHRYGITQQMIDQYSATGAAQASSSSSSSPPPRDPSQLSLSGLPKPQQLHLQQLQQTNNELKILQAQHTAKLTRFMQLLAKQSPFQAALGSATSTLFAPSTFGSRSHTAPNMSGSTSGLLAQHLVTSDESRVRLGSEPGNWADSHSGEDIKMSALASPSSTMSATSSAASLPHIRSFSQSFASTTGVDTPSPFSDSPYSRASSALLSSSTSSAV